MIKEVKQNITVTKYETADGELFDSILYAMEHENYIQKSEKAGSQEKIKKRIDRFTKSGEELLYKKLKYPVFAVDKAEFDDEVYLKFYDSVSVHRYVWTQFVANLKDGMYDSLAIDSTLEEIKSKALPIAAVGVFFSFTPNITFPKVIEYNC